MERIQSRDGTSIAFDRSGEGPPVICVPGLFQHRAFDPGTVELAALLAARFTVFHYDRRGRGDSGDTAPYAVEREVESSMTTSTARRSSQPQASSTRYS